MKKYRVLMNDGLEYIAYQSPDGGYVSIYTDEEDDAINVGVFLMVRGEVYLPVNSLLFGPLQKVGKVIEEIS